MLTRLVQLYALLPLSWVRAFGRLLGWLIYALDKRYRMRIHENLAIAAQASPQVRKAAIAGVGAGLAEAPWVWAYTPLQLKAWIQCDQTDLLNDLAKGQRPVVFLTPHLGSFEMTAKFLAAYLKITVLYKEPDAAALKPFMAKIRNAPNLNAAPASLGGVKTMLKALKAGQAVGILPDQVPRAGDGKWVPFFSQYAYTMTLPERLALTTQARVVIVVGTPVNIDPTSAPMRSTKTYWRFELEEMTENPSPENINKRLEKVILTRPELYLWGYNRYKRPAGAPAAPAAESDPLSTTRLSATRAKARDV
jgi:Kdo2-lipid IVA lauroyltransferase/acyltransferase